MMWRLIKNERGQSMVEMALVLPILLMIVFGIIEFGNIYSIKINMNNVVRQAVRTAVVSQLSEVELEDNMKADAISLRMLEDNISVCDINRSAGNVIATLNYNVPLITGQVIGSGTIELTAQATMKAE